MKLISVVGIMQRPQSHDLDVQVVFDVSAVLYSNLL